MSIWLIAAVVFQLFVILAIAIVWIRQVRPPKEDHRLSRGLQLLQSKIAVLEDLSDRTETQVKQLTQILDERAKNLQNKMLQAEETIMKIEQSMHKSLDVADIFQDKIPHEEIIERNQQSKYVHAAKLANEGNTLDQILAQVDLPRNEVEFIMKVNKDTLTFDPELLPEWAKPREAMPRNDLDSQMVERVFQTRTPDLSSLHRAEEEFKKTVREVEAFEREEAARIQQIEERSQAIQQRASKMTQSFVQGAGEMLKTSSQAASTAAGVAANAAATAALSAIEQAKPIVRKVQFPKIYVDKPK
jgi:Protein of unknown function (DUF2802)